LETLHLAVRGLTLKEMAVLFEQNNLRKVWDISLSVESINEKILKDLIVSKMKTRPFLKRLRIESQRYLTLNCH